MLAFSRLTDEMAAARKRSLLWPIAALAMGSLTLLVLLALLLVASFNRISTAHERDVVEHGFAHAIHQFGEQITPQADWDKSVEKLDHHFDAKFADVDFGMQLCDYFGFSHVYIINGADRVIYAAVKAHRAPASAIAPFAPIGARLLASIRAGEAHRPPIHPAPSGKAIVTKPIQTFGMARVNGQIYIVIATLIQPDVALVLPKGPHAPVVFAAMPMNQAMRDAFAARYLVDGLDVVASSRAAPGRASFALRDPDGQEIAALAWTPREPGTEVITRLLVPLGGGVFLLILLALVIVKRTGRVVDRLTVSEAHAKDLAYLDPLTLLPNRAALFEQLPHMLATSTSRGQHLAMLAIDLDRFKAINDTLGHAAGDALIKALADRLRAIVDDQPAAFAARLGGDEFVLVSMVADHTAAGDLASTCLASLLKPVTSEYGRLDVGCSIGVVLADQHEDDASHLLRQADLALYQAKGGGRARYAMFAQKMEMARQSRLQMEAKLRAALGAETFEVVYQPQVDARGTINACEALLRWSDPELGATPPARFIPLAEEFGLMLPIGEFVLRQVFAETAGWGAMRVAINVSAVQMRTPGFAAQVMRLAAAAGIDPRRYEIELTETSLLDDTETTEVNFHVLKQLGFTIVLDDFGTGYSSLSMLHRFQVDKIKIDRLFVADLGEDHKAEALVAAIIQLAHNFGVAVVAEGVETASQLQQLAAAGCSQFQGYFIGRPMPGAEMRRLAMPDGARRVAG